MRLIDIAKKYDFSKSSKELAMEFIYAANKYRVPLSKISFGIPKELDFRKDIEDDSNTYVKATIDPNYASNFAGDNGFMYLRLPLSVLQPKPKAVLRSPSYPFTTHGILPKINAYLGTQLTPNDVVNEEYRDSSVSFSLRASVKSLVWLGGLALSFYQDIPDNARLEETGIARTMESGTIRLMETALVIA
jgi:hypothetical protein